LTGGVSEQFSRQDLLRILRISRRELDSWQKSGLVPVADRYTFSDLIALKTLHKLRQNQIPVKRIQRSMEMLRRKLVEVERPLTELKIASDGRRIVVSYAGAMMDPFTGQYLFDFETRPLGAAVRALKRMAPATSHDSPQRRQEAEAWFVKGLRLEEDPATLQQALDAYQRAIELNPEAAGAYINLGTIHYNLHHLDEAERCYRRAAEIDPQYALACFNLGNVYDERGQLEAARSHYEAALRLQPGYADAHYNLALVLEKQGQKAKAMQHWRKYLKLDPASPWASYARQQLARTPFTVIENSRDAG
jgi:tetratricopeptide (TPR) repeat protein